ncbi:MAG: methyltransferase domain-containing protein [Chloroflexi bacterium]|nr:methyltransferase domain-containing protein [Chloroflexota bacterium]
MPLNERLLRKRSGNDVEFFHRARAVYGWLAPRPGETVLDCGCASGYNSRNVLALFRPQRIVAVDLDETLLRGAIAADEGGNVFFVQADARHLPFRDKSFDRTMFTEVLEHVPDDAGVLREVGRVTRAEIVLSTPHLGLARPAFPVNLVKWILMRLPLHLQHRYAHRSVYQYEHYTKDIVGHVRDGYTTAEFFELARRAGLTVRDYCYVYRRIGRRIIDLFYVLQVARQPWLQSLYFRLMGLDGSDREPGLCLVARLTPEPPGRSEIES